MTRRLKLAKLGDIAEVQSGGTPSISNKRFWGGEIPWYSSGELNTVITLAPERTVSAAGIANSNAKLFPQGSLLIGMYDTAALKMSILDRDAAFNQAIAGVKPNDMVNMRFVFYALSAIKEELLGQRRGVRQKNLSLGKVRDFPIPLLPVTEQNRIVTILDEAFAGIATAKANAEKNLQNARALFDGVQRELLTDVARRSETRELQSLCEVFFDSAHRTPTYQADGIPALRPRDIVNGVLNLSVVARVSEDEYEVQSKRYKPRAGDIVYSRELSYGWAAIVPAATTVCLSQGMCVFRPVKGILPRFLWRILNGPIGRSQAHQAAVGTAHPHINLGEIKAYRIPYLPDEQQCSVVESFDEIETEVESLASLARQKLARLDELKQSLLHQAFTGALTAKNADVLVAEVA